MSDSNITKVYLLSVPLENDYKHTLYFTSKANQQAFFESKIIKSYTNFSYQRKDNYIRVPEQFDKLQNVNYVMYQNSAYSNKWFYAFITDMKYVDDGRTDIFIETDYMQTWLFDINIKPSFIEREHVDNDDFGLHTVPEGLETGEYIINKHNQVEYGGRINSQTASDNLSIVIGSTIDHDGENFEGGMYNGIYSGIRYYVFPCTMDGVKQIKTFLSEYSEEARSSAIICMFLAPKSLAPTRDDNILAQTNTVDVFYINHDIEESEGFAKNIDFTDEKIDGYTPRNKKVLCYPYRYLIASNNNGADVVYNYEDFFNVNDREIVTPSFKIEGCLTPGCSIRMIPENYKGQERNDMYGLNLGKYPCLNWNSDAYTNWLTQNGVNIGISVVSSLLQIAGGVGLMATGGGALAGGGMIASGITGVAGSLGQVYQHSLTPPQSEGNTNCGDIVSASNKNDFHFYDMSIKKEYAEIIDKYFDMFGYKVNMVKVPNKAHRSRFWYTKTIDINIDGAIPNKDMQVIKDCYNKGITFWRNANEIQNYSLSNEVVE